MIHLNEKGQCPVCLIKPLKYLKRGGPHYFCWRCSRAFDLKTEEQIANFAWERGEGGIFVRVTRKWI